MLSRGRSLLFSIIAFIVFAGLLIVAPKVLPGIPGNHVEPLSELSNYIILGITALLALLIALGVYRKRGIAEKVKIFFTMVGFTFALAAIGNAASQQTRSLPNFVVILNWLEAVIMLVGGATCTTLAYLKGGQEQTLEGAGSGATRTSRVDESGATRRKAAPAADDAKSDPKSEAKAEPKADVKAEQVETSDKAPARGAKAPSGTKIPAMPGKELKPKNSMSNSASNLRGLLDTLAPDEDDKPADKPAPATASEIAAKADAVAKKLESSAAQKPSTSGSGFPEQKKPTASASGLPEIKKPTSSATGLPEQRKPTASSTATRLQAQKRKSTSTFIKLQALSSSGTGASRPKTADTAGTDASESLKSILDRLDSSDDSDIDFFGSESLIDKPDAADKNRISKTSMPAAGPRTSSSSIPAVNPAESVAPPTPAPTPPASTSLPRSGVTPDSKPLTPAASAVKPTTPAVSSPAAKPSPLSMKGSDTSIPALGSNSLAPAAAKPAAAEAAKSTPAPAPTPTPAPAPEPIPAAAAAAASVQPSLTDMLNSIKTPGTDPGAVAAPAKPDRPLGGLGGSGLGGTGLARVAGKKTGIALGKTSSTNLNKLELPSDAALEPVATAEIGETAVEAPAHTEEAIIQTVSETIVEAAPEPVALVEETPVVKPVVEPVVEPVAEAAAEAVAEPVAEVSVVPEPEPVAEVSEEPAIAAAVDDPYSEQINAAAAQVDAFSQTFVDSFAETATPPSTFSAAPKAESTPDLALEQPTNITELESFAAEPLPQPKTESFKPESFTPQSESDSFENFESTQDFETTNDAMMNFAADQTEEAADPPATLFESAAVDQEIEDIFSNLVPPEAQQEVNEATLSHTRLPALDPLQAQLLLTEPEEEVIAKPEVKVAKAETSAPAPAVEPKAVEAKAPPATPAPAVDAATEATSTLFESAAVDQEIEDIFSNLVPPEAQQVVNESTLSHNRLQAMDAQEAKALLRKDDEAKNTPELAAKVEAKAEPKVATPVAPEPAKEVAKEEEKKEGLFDPTLDQEIDEIFHSLAPEEALAEVTDETLAKVKSTDAPSGEMSFAPDDQAESKPEPAATPAVAAASTEQAAPAKKAESFEPDSSTANQVMNLLDSLEAKTTPEAEADPVAQEMTADVTAAINESVKSEAIDIEPSATTSSAEGETAEAEAATPAVNKPKEVKEFGRLSAKSANAGTNNETVGTMKTIGKLLIDVPAIENIIRTGETGTIGKNLATARVISTARGEGINALLNKIDSFPGIEGTLIVGHDGLVISSTLKHGSGKDRDTIGALSVACLGSTNLGTRKLEIGKLKQMVFITDTTITVLTDVEVGILAVLLDHLEIDKIDGVLQAIHDTIHG